MVENESPPLGEEDWNVVFRAYEEYPVLAFILAQHLDTIRKLIHQSEKRAEAIATLDRAIETLMPHTDFRDAGREVYLRAVAGITSQD